MVKTIIEPSASVPVNHVQILQVEANVKLRDDTPILQE